MKRPTTNLFFACSLVFVGVILVFLPWIAAFRQGFIELLLTNKAILMLLGVAISSIGSLLLINTINQRHHYYHVSKGNRAITVDNTVINQYLHTYWQNLFPNKKINSDVLIKKNSLHIVAELPDCPFEKQDELLKKIEDDLTDLFNQILDYKKKLTLSIHFTGSKETPP